MYASDWLFALFSNIIPIGQYHHFLDGFFSEGWAFFYKFSMSFLKCLRNEILECSDQSELLNLIKLKYVKTVSPSKYQLSESESDSNSSSEDEEDNDDDSDIFDESSSIQDEESKEHI